MVVRRRRSALRGLLDLLRRARRARSAPGRSGPGRYVVVRLARAAGRRTSRAGGRSAWARSRRRARCRRSPPVRCPTRRAPRRRGDAAGARGGDGRCGAAAAPGTVGSTPTVRCTTIVRTFGRLPAAAAVAGLGWPLLRGDRDRGQHAEAEERAERRDAGPRYGDAGHVEGAPCVAVEVGVRRTETNVLRSFRHERAGRRVAPSPDLKTSAGGRRNRSTVGCPRVNGDQSGIDTPVPWAYGDEQDRSSLGGKTCLTSGCGGRRKDVLVVEDESRMARLLARALDAAGFQPAVEPGGLSGLAAAAGRRLLAAPARPDAAGRGRRRGPHQRP